MKKSVNLSVFERSMLDKRSDILLYGSPEIFLDGVVDDQNDVSPDATAAKLIADFAQLYAVLSEQSGEPPAYEKIDVTGPMGKLIEPLIGGDSAYLNDAESSAEIFASMLAWVGSERWFSDEATAAEQNRFVIKQDDGPTNMDGDAVAAYLTLGILLDSADVQVVVDQDLRLDLVHTFRCFSHLLGRLDRLIGNAAKSATTGDMALRAVFADGLRCLNEDGVVREEDTDFEAETVH